MGHVEIIRKERISITSGHVYEHLLCAQTVLGVADTEGERISSLLQSMGAHCLCSNLPLNLADYITWGKFFDLSVPQFPILYDEDNNSTDVKMKLS